MISKEKIDNLYKTLSGSLVHFGGIICNDLVSGDIPPFHVELCELLSKEERVVLAAPRGFSKSTWVSRVYPLWCGLFGKKKNILIISASEGLAVEHLRWIKLKVESDEIVKALFGDLVSDKWSENHIILKLPNGDMVTIQAKGAEGQIRGFRPDCIILDDIETNESVDSEDRRKKLKTWLFTACINCLLPEGQLILIGTVIHPLAVINDLLETPNGWTKRRWKAYVDGEGEGKSLWNDLRPHSWLQQRKKEIGSFAFAAEYMNDPMADENAAIKSEQIRYWHELPSQYSSVIAVDPAYSEENSADWKVASLVLIDQNQSRYLGRYIRTHVPTGEFIDAILNMYLENRNTITAIGIPNSGVESLFFSSVVKRAEERKIYAPFVELKNSFITAAGQKISNKKNRIIASLQPLFENGKYYIHPDHYEAREELLTIGSSKNDDLVDTLCYAEQIITPYFGQEVQEVGRYGEEEYITPKGYDYGY